MSTMTPAPPFPHPHQRRKAGQEEGEVDPRTQVIGGVDTHRDQHVAAVINGLGQLLGVEVFDADPAGYAALLSWLATHGTVRMIGIEGTGSYGLGLARHLAQASTAQLVEIDRPERRTRRARGKSDPIDAESAARTAWSQARTTVPKIRDSQVEALRVLRIARRSAVEDRADVVRQMKSVLITAPADLRARLSGLPAAGLVRAAMVLRPDTTKISDPAQAAKHTLRALARRHRHLSEEITEHDTLIAPLVAAINPALLAINGVGPDTVGQLLVTAGANPERIHSEAAFAMLCGAAPIPASSGATHRMRLNRGGDRQANAALYRILLARMRWHQPTTTYLTRRVTHGNLTKSEATRCLKRYIAREIYPALLNPHHGLDHP